ncbi:MAG: universal stress protein [Thalassolituus sp.]|jgi:nucleotide-binding universal stress UspA family protein|tara:strand:- start:11205 stop:12056 length:852 start_codon:yes stop_codon:yes gene_type:complete
MNQITACIDGSNGTTAVCAAASWVSQQLEKPLCLLHVLEKPAGREADLSGSIGLGSREHLLAQLSELDAQRNKLAIESGHLMLEAAKDCAHNAGVTEVSTLQRHGRLAWAVAELEEEIRVLVMGRQGDDHSVPSDNAVGSHLETVLRTVKCPVLVTAGEFVRPTSFMVAYDGSEPAQRALASYGNSPLLRGLPCHLVMVNHDDEAHKAQLEQAAGQLREEGFEVTVAYLSGDVQSQLLAYQQKNSINMIVMGAYGHSRIRQFFLGSHTRNMVSHTSVPLLLLR